jgi:hypothetical protein
LQVAALKYSACKYQPDYRKGEIIQYGNRNISRKVVRYMQAEADHPGSDCSVGWCWFVLREEYYWLVAGLL